MSARPQEKSMAAGLALQQGINTRRKTMLE